MRTTPQALWTIPDSVSRPVRECTECGQLVSIDRKRAVFCSRRCADRSRQRRRRAPLELSVIFTGATLSIRVERGRVISEIWGVSCDIEVAQALWEDSRRRPQRRRRRHRPIFKRDNVDV